MSMTIQLILYRGKRDDEEYTEILKSESKQPQAGLPCHGLLPPPSHPPPDQHLDTRCGWHCGDTVLGGPGPGRREPGKGNAGGAGSRVPMARGHLGEGAGGAPCPHPGHQVEEEEGEDEEEKEREEASLWICTDSGGNGSVSPGRFLI